MGSEFRAGDRGQAAADFVRFNAVGLLGFGLQLALLAVFRDGLRFNVLAATAAAVECTVLHNFVWHERWTWGYRGLGARGRFARLLRFHVGNGAVSIAGSLAATDLLAVRWHWPLLAANTAGVAFCSLVDRKSTRLNSSHRT